MLLISMHGAFETTRRVWGRIPERGDVIAALWGGGGALGAARPPGRGAGGGAVEPAAGGALDTRQRIVDEDLRAVAAAAVEDSVPELAEGLAAMQCGGGPR